MMGSMNSPAEHYRALSAQCPHPDGEAGEPASAAGGGMARPVRDLLPPCPAVLDIGCGSGEPTARYLAERGCKVTGVDSAPEMIAICQDALPQESWGVADMRNLSLGRSFDGILAWDSLFHLCQDDQRQMFPIFRSHAASRAALMFTSGPGHGESIGTFEGEPLYHASLDGAEYWVLLDENGFAVVAYTVEDPACGRLTVWLAQRR
jgi:SAM-dependent methyltransferase